MLTARKDAARRLLSSPSTIARAIAGGAAVLAVAVGSTVAASAASVSPACPNPLAETRNFTVVVEGDAALGSTGAGGEIEGSLAAGGNVSFGLYNFLDNSDGSSMPAVGGPATQLLVGGTVDYSSGQKLDLNAGHGKITDTAGLSVTADGRLVLADANRYVKSQFGAVQNSISDYTAAAGTFSEAFPADYFDRLRRLSGHYAALAEGDGTAMVAATGSGERHLVLQEGKTNVWNVGAAELSAATSATFDGVTPSAATRLVINVIPDGSTDVGGLRFNGDPISDRHFAPWVVWNFHGWENLRLVGATEMSGVLLAPDAALDYNRSNPFRGQVIAQSINITGSGEIHHWSYEAAACTAGPDVTVTPTPTVTPTGATMTPTPEATVTPTREAAVTPEATVTGAVLVSVPETPSAPTTLPSTSTDQLAETGFDRAWIVTAALVLMSGGLVAMGLTRVRQGMRAAGNRARH